MNCKNCQDPLEENAQFCDNCGAKVVTYRITFKILITDFFIDTFGVDSRFFITLKKMLTHPDDVIQEYLTGVRKRYVNPFAFLAVGAALSLLLFNYYADDFIKVQSSPNTESINKLKEISEKEITSDLSKKEAQKLKIDKGVAKLQLQFMDNLMQFMLRYYNLLTFVFLFIYAILSKWTYWRPHNFGEHIVINAYIYGFATYFTILAFVISMLTTPEVYTYSMLVYILYYMYVFRKLYQHSILKTIIKLLRFLIGLIVLFAIIMLIGVIVIAGLTKIGVIKI